MRCPPVESNEIVLRHLRFYLPKGIIVSTSSATYQQDRDRYRILFENSSDAHFIFDESGIIDCNAATVRLLGADNRQQVMALHPGVLSPQYQPDGRLSVEKAQDMDQTAREVGYHRFSWVHRKLDGEEFPVEVTLNPVTLDGRPAMIAVWHDLTEIKRVERELQRRGAELEAANRVLVDLNARLKQDLVAAARLQKALLPATLPQSERARFAWTFQPCEELAGDILNIYQLDATKIGFYVLDVSGHGVSAALLSVSVSRFLSPHGPHSFMRTSEGRLARPGEVLARLNHQFSDDRSEQFFTLFYGVLDVESYELTYCNAGHPGPAIISQEGAVTTLPESSLPIGIIAEVPYEEHVVRLTPGDCLWLYSDGLLEAMDEGGHQFGSKRLDEALQAAARMPLHDRVGYLMTRIAQWTGEHGPQDDISIVAFEVA